jgi:hypothetical protein
MKYQESSQIRLKLPHILEISMLKNPSQHRKNNAQTPIKFSIFSLSVQLTSIELCKEYYK